MQRDKELSKILYAIKKLNLIGAGKNTKLQIMFSQSRWKFVQKCVRMLYTCFHTCIHIILLSIFQELSTQSMKIPMFLCRPSGGLLQTGDTPTGNEPKSNDSPMVLCKSNNGCMRALYLWTTCSKATTYYSTTRCRCQTVFKKCIVMHPRENLINLKKITIL